jgi:hypothetical protein
MKDYNSHDGGLEKRNDAFNVCLLSAQEVMSGERVYADVVYNELKKRWDQFNEDGIDTSELRDSIGLLLKGLPTAEVKNILARSLAFWAIEDRKNALDYCRGARKSMESWESRGAVVDNEVKDKLLEVEKFLGVTK